MNRKWGSLLGNAVANLESKLDTILAEDGNPKKPLPGPRVGASERARSTSRVRKEQPTRTSTDSQNSTNQRTSLDITKTTTSSILPEVQVHEAKDVDGETLSDLAEADTSGSGTNTQLQTDDPSITEPLLSLDEDETSSTTVQSDALHAQLAQLRGDNEAQEVQRQKEVHNYLERIDALQAKLSYLASEAASNARTSAEAAPTDSLEKKLAAKDEQIALLLEEGQKLSKAEVTQSTTLRKLRAKVADDGRVIADLRRKLVAADKSSADKAETLTRLEIGVKEAGGKLVRLARAEREVEELKKLRDTRDAQIKSLQEQLDSAQSKAKTDERETTAKALEAERKVAQSLKDDLVSVKLEKQLAEDKRQAELKAASDEKDRQRERHAEIEATLRHEISVCTMFNSGRSHYLIRYRYSKADSRCSVVGMRKPHQQPAVIVKPSSFVRSSYSNLSTPKLATTFKASKARFKLVLPPSSARGMKLTSRSRIYARKLERLTMRHVACKTSLTTRHVSVVFWKLTWQRNRRQLRGCSHERPNSRRACRMQRHNMSARNRPGKVHCKHALRRRSSSKRPLHHRVVLNRLHTL